MNGSVFSTLRSCCKLISSCNRNSCALKAPFSRSLYESSISLRSLYPTSSLKLSSPNKIPQSKDGKFSGYIPLDKVQITYSRSSGPGGQAVNMINTKVDLRFHVDSADWLSESTRTKLKEKEKHKISKEGVFIIRSEKTRSQQLNLADTLEKLRSLIHALEVERPPPSVETEELIRKRKEKASQMRLIEKRTRSMIKADRKAPSVDY